MILTKKQIQKIRIAWKRAEIAEAKSQSCQKKLGELISEITGVPGLVDHLQGDGMGFTPLSDNDTHIPISDLIQFAELGEDISEEFILDNLII